MFTPRETVEALDKYIVGQDEAKRAVAIALRNRYRRSRLSPEMREEITPKNIIMVGPTGVGKTEIARRLAKLVDAPLVKVEATKFTEVGYVGRDVDSIVRDLVEASIRLCKQKRYEAVETVAKAAAEQRLIELLMPTAGKKTYQVNRMGVARTFQNIRLFKELSVIDNIKVGLHESMKYNLGSSLIRLPNYWKEEKRCTERAFELLDIFHMADLADAQAGSLPYGAQRRLEIMRALATSPKLLLLDEPAAGMNPSETAELTETIRRIRDEFNIAVLLIEHDMSLVMGICEGIAVLNFGRIIAKGTPDEIRNNPQVIEAYLGKKEG